MTIFEIKMLFLKSSGKKGLSQGIKWIKMSDVKYIGYFYWQACEKKQMV